MTSQLSFKEWAVILVGDPFLEILLKLVACRIDVVEFKFIIYDVVIDLAIMIVVEDCKIVGLEFFIRNLVRAAWGAYFRFENYDK